MVDPRVYRTGLIAVLLAVIVVAFSLYDQDGPLGTTLAPDAFNGQNAEATMASLAKSYPSRPPGSSADRAIAGYVARQLTRSAFMVSRNFFTGQTADGPRRLENVIGVRPGLAAGSVVVVAPRDAVGSPAEAAASGTAVLLELARVLSGETQDRTIVLASTSGSVGAAGTTQLARTLGRPVDAVAVLGDLAGSRVRDPVIVPWSGGQQVAPTMLRNTVALALSSQAALASGKASLAAQIAHFAFPMSISTQAPFGARGEPAVLLSVSGEREPAADEPTSATQINSMGRTVLATVSALDGGRAVPAPSSYLIWNGKVVPAWAIRLIVLALMIPVLVATIDALARARRRGHAVTPWVVWVLSGALPFVLAVLVVLASRLVGLIGASPPQAVGAGEVPLQSGGVATLALVGCAIIVGFGVLRPLMLRFIGPPRRGSRHGDPGRRPPYGPASATALMLVVCVVSLLVWFDNPFAALLLVPALHLWLWGAQPELRLPRSVRFGLVAIGFVPPVLVALYYSLSQGLTFADAAWNGVLLLAGGGVGAGVALAWSVILGCLASAVLIALRPVPQSRARSLPVAVRGPVTYAGPGSLGGTESALRR
jgi:hypothetical protein